ncbi:MAG TPA: mechanosensitive ion channel domain-containing protein [bacterium]|nr:mechanosensitive ion channel domain-containing protein [bacterium]
MELNPLESAYAPIGDLLKGQPWWFSVAIFAAYVAFLFAVQWLVFRLLRRWTVKRANPWYGLVLGALQSSILLFLVSGMVGMAPVIFRMTKDLRKFVGNLAELIAILAFAVFFQKLLLAAYRRWVARDEATRTHSTLIRVLISIGVYSIFLMFFLQTAGISITPLIASLGVGSVAIAFALQETLSSLFAGFYIVADRPIRVGDFVRLESGEEGYVESIGWRSVRIRMIPHNIVIVPNSKLAGGIVTNYSMPNRELSLMVDVGVEYSSDLEKVERIALETARQTLREAPGSVPDFEPRIRWSGFGDSSIGFTIVLRAREFIDQYEVRNDFVKRLHRRFNEEGVTIPFPIRTLHWRTGSEPSRLKGAS